MEYFCEGSAETLIGASQAAVLLDRMLAQLGDPRRVLLLPPDFTRVASGAGSLTVLLYERLKDRASVEVMPALGTHVPMTPAEIAAMFPGIPPDAFRVHDWRGELVRLGEVPAEFVRHATDGRLDFPIACDVNRRLVDGRWDSIISLGQVLPHEVAGIAGQSKNVLIGCGGPDTIHKTHFVGAVCGMEQAMGRTAAPVRRILDYMADRLARQLPLTYVLTVRGRNQEGTLVTRGLFAGDDGACFARAAELCRQVNITLLDAPLERVVVYLDPDEYKSTWLGNKAIYRTRLAIADGGELIVLAPGVRRFGEDAEIDRLIRKYGYRGTTETLRRVRADADLANNLAAAAHLIHGSSEGRFRITYCPGGLSRREIEEVGYAWGDLTEMSARYGQPAQDGWRATRDGQRAFFVSDPGQGLWALRSQFEPGAGTAEKER
jgi:nickel-dependent lactate racemase